MRYSSVSITAHMEVVTWKISCIGYIGEWPADCREAVSNLPSPGYIDQPLTEIQEGDLYFCPELRKVCVGDTETELTVKEFDALYLLISNRNRILTFETLARQIWGKEYVDITRKTIHNLMSRVRCKSKNRSHWCFEFV